MEYMPADKRNDWNEQYARTKRQNSSRKASGYVDPDAQNARSSWQSVLTAV